MSDRYDYCYNATELCNKDDTTTFVFIIIIFMMFVFLVGVFTYYHRLKLGFII